MTIIEFFAWFQQLISLPAVIVFLGTAVILTVKIGFLQITGLGRLMGLFKNGIPHADQQESGTAMRTISPSHALFAALGTTIGMGNLSGPPMAVFVGGPGALFWLLVYIFFSSATKFTEVCFALYTRKKNPDGNIIGGPMRYLEIVHPYLARWYAFIMLGIFVSWSTVQSNTMAQIFAQEGVPTWFTGAVLVSLTFLVLIGGSQRVGEWASKLVPFMFCLYVSFAFYLLVQDLAALRSAFSLIMGNAFTPSAALGGFVGATVYQAVKSGLYKGVFISEAGMGTSSIPHAVADVKYPTDQGLLALYSMISDALLSMISGLLVLTAGVWMRGEFRATLLYEVFVQQSPLFGRWVFLITIVLFAFTTVVGNLYNGRQVFGSLTQFRGVNAYIVVALILVFCSALAEAKIVWELMEFLLPFVAIPHLIGVLILTYRYPDVLKVRKI